MVDLSRWVGIHRVTECTVGKRSGAHPTAYSSFCVQAGSRFADPPQFSASLVLVFQVAERLRLGDVERAF
ncbi:MAG: hypothetical protein AB7E18_05505, partial [Stutzerimonas sp.]|uniref:hypothetical protein n=1 Tax=Stutzerimonas sp. TaxID=2901166 RepID=UPI003D0F4CDB